MDDDCGDEFVGYNEWATASLGVAFFTDFVYDYEDGERGVFVAEDIAPQTRVLSVPFASLLTLDWLRNQVEQEHPVYARVSLFRSLVETPRSAWDPEHEDDLLAIVLLYERFGARAASPWRPHLELLPKSYDNLLYFTKNELQALRGSNVHLLGQQMHHKVQEDYERLQASVLPELFDAVLACHPDLTREIVETNYSLDEYTWALSTIWSRFVSLRLHKVNGEVSAAFPVVKAMAPVFDMLNHDPFAEVSHGYNSETHSLEIVTHQHVAAGTQLCINYGAVSNHKLLTLYGFVVEGNPYDSMELWIPMDKNSTLYDAKAKALLELGIDHEITAFELTAMNDEDVDPAMLLSARISQLECRDEKELQSCVEKITFGETASDENEMRSLGMLIRTLETMIVQYEGSDTVENVDGERDERSKHLQHMRMVAVVRESDQLILENTIETLKRMLTKVSVTEEGSINR